MASAEGRTGSTVGKYKLHEIVGRGGMGVVYRGEHVYIGREVAVKILHEGYGGREESIKRFLREARAASLINHPNIVEVTDFGKANDGTVFFVMELLVGEPLDNILARERRLDLLRSIIICNQLTAALAAAHSKGIIHRDLKPENVMLIPREGRRELVRRVLDESGAHELSEREKRFDFVKILDFGVAKVREPDDPNRRVTKSGVVFGTPEYMAPETARIGHSDARSDIYALGVMFYEMMTGTVPFTAEAPVEVMMKQVNEPVPPMRKVAPDAEITEDAERMILKALAKDPDHRHQSMEEFHRDLQKCYGQLRFRRTVHTPTAAVPAVEDTPVNGAIPLTKKKAKHSGEAGALPTAMSGGSSASNEIEAAFARPRGPTPPLPGLPLNATAPILLTRKKAPRSEQTPPRGAPTPSSPTESSTNGRPRHGMIAEIVTPADAELATPTPAKDSGGPDQKASLERRRRNTLRLGLEEAAATTSITPTTGTASEGGEQERKVPPLHVPAAPLTIAMAAPRIAKPLVTETLDPAADRDTPRVALTTRIDTDEKSWLDETTSPALPGYPAGYPNKTGKAG